MIFAWFKSLFRSLRPDAPGFASDMIPVERIGWDEWDGKKRTSVAAPEGDWQDGLIKQLTGGTPVMVRVLPGSLPPAQINVVDATGRVLRVFQL